MRAMRFASVLGFEIEKETHDALLKNAWLLKNVSSERICTELLSFCAEKTRSMFYAIIPRLSLLLFPS